MLIIIIAILGAVFFSVIISDFSWKKYLSWFFIINISLFAIQILLGFTILTGERGLILIVTFAIQVIISFISFFVFSLRKVKFISPKSKPIILGIVFTVIFLLIMLKYHFSTIGYSRYANLHYFQTVIFTLALVFGVPWAYKAGIPRKEQDSQSEKSAD